MRRGRNDVAAARVDLVLEHQSHRLSGDRFGNAAIPGDDFLDTAGHSRRTYTNTVTVLDRATGDAARESAKLVVRPVDPLHRHGKWFRTLTPFSRDGLEPLQKARTFVPRHSVAVPIDDIVTFERRQRNRGDC